jgi:hypothetical protein
VSPSIGCRGTITIKIKRGAQGFSSPQARLSGKCTYSVSSTLRLSGKGTLAVTATFVGNPVLTTKSHPAIKVPFG